MTTNQETKLIYWIDEHDQAWSADVDTRAQNVTIFSLCPYCAKEDSSDNAPRICKVDEMGLLFECRIPAPPGGDSKWIVTRHDMPDLAIVDIEGSKLRLRTYRPTLAETTIEGAQAIES